MDDLVAIWPPNNKCPVFGVEFGSAVLGTTKQGPRRNSASLDRIDNARGYERGNCAILSNHANYLKGGASLDELIALGEWAARRKALQALF